MGLPPSSGHTKYMKDPMQFSGGNKKIMAFCLRSAKYFIYMENLEHTYLLCYLVSTCIDKNE